MLLKLPWYHVKKHGTFIYTIVLNVYHAIYIVLQGTSKNTMVLCSKTFKTPMYFDIIPLNRI